MVRIETNETVARRMLLELTQATRRWDAELKGYLARGASPDDDDIRIIADAGAEARAAVHVLDVALRSQTLPVVVFPDVTESENRALWGDR